MENVNTVGTIIDPIVLSENLLTDDIFSGSITFQNKYGIDGNKFDSPITYTRPFLLTSNFGFSLGNEWKSLIPKEAIDILDSMYNLYSMLNIKSIMGKETSAHNISFTSKAMSALAWKGSSNPEFSVEMIFVATRRSYNPIDIIKELAMTCLPTKLNDHDKEGAQQIKDGFGSFVSDIGGWLGEKITNQFGQTLQEGFNQAGNIIKNSGLMSPLEYKVSPDYDNDEAIAEGTVTLCVGRWFRAHKLVVKSISNIEFSKETIAPPSLHTSIQQRIYNGVVTTGKSESWGFPLYAKCTVTLIPIAPITYDEFCKYFIEPSTNILPSLDIGDIHNNAISEARNYMASGGSDLNNSESVVTNDKDSSNTNKTGEVQ